LSQTISSFSEEERVHPVVDVVVLLGHRTRAARSLQVHEARLEGLERARGADQRALLGVRGKDAAEQLVERVAVPVAVDVRLADAEGAAQCAAVEPVAIHANVPGAAAVEADTGPGEQRFEQRLEDSVRHV
jgi:hypothetical protein